jgi:AcrR family transcriptional regulator
MAMMTTAVLRKGERTRQIFIEAGSRVFVRDGYLNAEISEIAKEAGKSNGTFYIYFENKTALLDAMIEAFEEDVLERFQEHDDSWYGASEAGDWEMIVTNMWKTFTRHAATFQALSQACLVDQHFGDAYSRIRERTRSDFVNFLKARQKLGFCKTVNIQYVAMALETMIVYCLNEWLAEGGRCHDRREEKKALAALTGIFTAAMSMD